MAGQYVAFDIGEAQVKIVSFAGGKVKKAVSEGWPGAKFSPWTPWAIS